MICFRKYFCICIASALVLAAVPAYHPEDVSRDSRVDLADVLMQIQELSSGDPAPPDRASLRDLVSAIQVVAGMKTVIESTGDDGAAGSGLNLCYLGASALMIDLPDLILPVEQRHRSRISHAAEPPGPPPPESA